MHFRVSKTQFVDLTGAQKGHLQLLDPHSGVLELSAQRRFEAPFLKFFDAVRIRAGDSICGEAIGSVSRIHQGLASRSGHPDSLDKDSFGTRLVPLSFAPSRSRSSSVLN